MKRLAACAGLSFTLYLLMFGWLLDRPLSLGLLRLEILQKTARLSQLPSPKLVILAGSNGPYSHSCAVLGAMLDLPCENAGIAVGIGLDDLFRRDSPYLHAGDIVYMPMETAQYVLTRAQNRAGADDGILLRHDKTLAMKLPADHLLGAIFCCDLADLVESIAEMPIAQAGLIRPAAMLARQYNPQGDRINTTLATVDRDLLTMPGGNPPDAAAIRQGYGSSLIGNFVARETARGIIVIGGLPTQFDDVKLPPADLKAISFIYAAHGGQFLVLPNQSEYPRADFYDSADHLSQPCQFMHSILLGRALAAALRRNAVPPPADAVKTASTCPA